MSNPIAAGGVRPADPIRLALALAMAVGLIEACYVLVREHLLGLPMHLGPEVIWMAPVANLLWFIPLALIASLVLWVRPSASVVALFGTLLVPALALGLLYPRLHRGAGALLATGVALQGARLLAPRLAMIRGRLAAVTLILAGLVTAAGIGLAVRRDQTATPIAAAPVGKPNVLLLVLDTVRAEDLGLYGHAPETAPGIVRLARDGAVFARAYATAPWTLPSHASMFTGRLPHELSVSWTAPLDDRFPTLAEALRARGYRTGGFVGNTLYCARDFGLARGFDHYQDFDRSLTEILINSSLGRVLSSSRNWRDALEWYQVFGRKDAPAVDGDVVDWIGADTTRPFFAFINYLDAHQPYLPPAEIAARFVSAETPRAHGYRYLVHEASLEFPESLSVAQLAREREAYDAAINYLDARVDSLLGALGRRGLLDRTLVILTSDHGEQFGEHGLVAHGNSVYSQTLWVPLVIRFPGRVPAGLELKTPVSLRDLPATVFDLADLARDSTFPGQSWAGIWRGDYAPARSPVVARVKRDGKIHRALVLGDEHYLRFDDGREAVYQIWQDPGETDDLLARRATAHPAEWYAALLDSLIPPERSRRSSTASPT